MSEQFNSCVDRGGRVRTEALSDTEYRVVCSIDGDVYYGETHTRKTDKEKRRAALKTATRRKNRP